MSKIDYQAWHDAEPRKKVQVTPSSPTCSNTNVVGRFFVGQKIPSVYNKNKGYTVIEIDKRRCKILMKQDGIDKAQWFELSQFQNGL